MRRRRRRRSEFAVSLFPFLCILAAVIGVLTLLISSLAMSQVVASPPVEMEFDEEQIEQWKRAIEEQTEESASLEQRLGAADELERQLRNERARQTRRRSEQAGEQQVRQDIDRAKRDIDRSRGDYEETKRQTAEAESETQRRRRDANRERTIRVTGGSGREQRPYFVECRKNELVIHGVEGPISRVKDSAIKTDSAFQSLLSKVKREKGSRAIIIFLIRPDGVPTFKKAAEHTDSKKVRHGKLPLPTFDAVDLSRFHDVMR